MRLTLKFMIDAWCGKWQKVWCICNEKEMVAVLKSEINGRQKHLEFEDSKM